MKYFFVLLLFVNVVFFLWEQNGDVGRSNTPVMHSQSPPRAGLRSIVLVGEIGAEEAAAPAEGPPLAAGASSRGGVTTPAPEASRAVDLRPDTQLEEAPPETEEDIADIRMDGGEAAPSAAVQDSSRGNASAEGARSTEEMPDESKKGQLPDVGDEPVSEEAPAKDEVAEKATDSPTIPTPAVSQEFIAEPRCFAVGLFDDETAADAIVVAVSAAGGQAMRQLNLVDEEDGYLVVFPAPETFEESIANVQMLKQRGVEDVWLLDQGPLSGAVSLGFFDTRERAIVLQNQFATQGITTEVAPRIRQRQRYRVLTLWARGENALRDLLAARGGSTQAGQVMPATDCASEQFSE